MPIVILKPTGGNQNCVQLYLLLIDVVKNSAEGEEGVKQAAQKK